MGVAALTALASLTITVTGQSQAPAAKAAATAKAAPAPKTAWGEPDLQGIWTDDFQLVLQRPARYATKEFFTDQERDEIDKQRAGLLRREVRAERGTEKDVAGAYNAVFMSFKHTGKRTSLIVDSPDGRVPALTPEAKRLADLDRDYRLALLQSTEVCKNKEAACNGWKYDSKPSPRRNELPPTYSATRMNRKDGPEDLSLN